MRISTLIFAALLLVPGLRSAMAQEPTSLPPLVQQHIDDDTILLARFNLTQPGIDNVSAFLSELSSPSRLFGMRAAEMHTALSNLQHVRKGQPQRFGEAFIVMSTNDLPLDSLVLIVPVTGSDADCQAVVDAFKGIGAGTTESAAGGVVHWTGKPRVYNRAAATPSRVELMNALTEVKESHMQFAISPGPDARRVLREFWPILPLELGGGSGVNLIDGLKWVALGITPTVQPELRFIIQGQDEQYAVSAEKFLQAALQLAASSDVAKGMGGNADRFFGLLKPIQNASQLSIVIDKTNAAQATVIEELAVPLLMQVQRNAVLSRTINNLKELKLACITTMTHTMRFRHRRFLHLTAKNF